MPGVSLDAYIDSLKISARDLLKVTLYGALNSAKEFVYSAAATTALAFSLPVLVIYAAHELIITNQGETILEVVERDQKAQWGVSRANIEAADRRREERANFARLYSGARIGRFS